MLTIAKLFGKSPFAPLQTHMEKVFLCMEGLQSLFAALDEGNLQEVEKQAKHISHLEHEADLTKHDIRVHLPKSFLLPINREDFLHILELQDEIANQIEDAAITATFSSKPLDLYSAFQKDFQEFREKNLASVSLVRQLIEQLQALVAASFGGVEAQKTRKMIDHIAYCEHEVDILQYALVKKLFRKADQLSNASFYLWRSLFKELASLSNLSEKLANRIRMILELK